jgi:hypothetical protein
MNCAREKDIDIKNKWVAVGLCKECDTPQAILFPVINKSCLTCNGYEAIHIVSTAEYYPCPDCTNNLES